MSSVTEVADEVVHVTVEPEDTFIFSDSAILRRFTKQDYLIAFVLALFTLALNSLGLGTLEFFRHTEADRTLIAWNMYENGDYMMPQLVHSHILTKPPLYYWTLAGAMHLFGGVSEAIARFPSVFFSMLFVVLQFFVARRAGGSRDFAVVSALVLETSFIFFHQSTVAEIDLVFGFLSACAFTAGYFGLVRNKPIILLLSYCFCALAFLAKGPPVVFFYLAGQGSMFLHLHFSKAKLPSEKTHMRGMAFFLWNFVGVVLFLFIVSRWLLYISNQFGLAQVVEQFNIEVVQRIVNETHLRRGPFFYLGALGSGLVPWTPFLIAGLLLALYRHKKGLESPIELRSDAAKSFIMFNLLYLLPALLMLSIASGKSVRYIFPVHFCAAYLTSICIFLIARHPVRRWFYLAGVILGCLTALALPITGLNMKLGSVPTSTQVFTAALMSLPLWGLVYACSKASARGVFFCIVFTMVGLRVGEWKVFSPYRSELRTVKPIAREIDEIVPKGVVIYNIELFDRWITYYLKQLGRDTWRMDDFQTGQPQAYQGRVYLLLNYDEEYWRIEQLREVDPTVKIVEDFKRPKTHVILVEAAAEAMPHLQPQLHIPTKPSPPFYNDPEKAKNYKAPNTEDRED